MTTLTRQDLNFGQGSVIFSRSSLEPTTVSNLFYFFHLSLIILVFALFFHSSTCNSPPSRFSGLQLPLPLALRLPGSHGVILWQRVPQLNHARYEHILPFFSVQDFPTILRITLPGFSTIPSHLCTFALDAQNSRLKSAFCYFI